MTQRILQGAPNFRDLGGMETADGRRVKPHRLLRSGHLHDLTAADRRRVTEEYQLKTVIDLRTSGEMQRKPDVILPGVTYIHLPIFENQAEGVTRETVTDTDPVGRMIAMAEKMEGQAFQRMRELYKVFFDDHGIAMYRRFFEQVLAQEEGAVLWHCTMGKDRCGTAAALLETALGVPYETVKADYLLTNEFVLPETEKTIAKARERIDDEALFEQMRVLDSVYEEFLDTVLGIAVEKSGSVPAFIEQHLGMTPDKLARLRDLYLE